MVCFGAGLSKNEGVLPPGRFGRVTQPVTPCVRYVNQAD
jgi:hypothetical protein